jgi:hypothetical protein
LIAGLVLLAVYALVSRILSSARFSPLTSEGSYSLLHFILDKIFLLALITLVLSILAWLFPRILPKPLARVDYALAVFKLFDPGNAPIARVLDKMELYPGFPYASRESDHPSFWPKRVWDERKALYKILEPLYTNPAVQTALAGQQDFNPNSSKVLGKSSLTAEESATRDYIMTARGYLNNLWGTKGPEAVQKLLGSSFDDFVRSEQARQAIRENFPNRVAVLRFNNSGRLDVPNLSVEFEIAGALYDCTNNADPARVLRSNWDQAAQRMQFDRLPRGYDVEIRIFYQYQSLSERVFPDKINFIQELTQGIRILNIAATRTQVRFDPALLEKLEGYERLYLGDARKKESYDDDLAVLHAKLGKETLAAMQEYSKKNPELKDLPLEKLATLEIPLEQIDNIWVTFDSPAKRAYTIVHAFTYIKGQYVLLSSKDKDRDDFTKMAGQIASAWKTKAGDISDRSDDICMSIDIASGLSPEAILAACRQLGAAGCSKFKVTRVYYHTADATAAAEPRS